ncbi:MAG TPA: hypothetical protein VF384_19100 [Planctomycetota bacterium]
MHRPLIAASWCVLLLPPVLRAQQPADAKATAETPAPASIDFTKVDRTPPKLPPTTHATYGIYLFGDHGQHRVWVVLDAKAAGEPPATLYFDRDGDGDLTEPGESCTGKPKQGKSPADVEFLLGDLKAPGAPGDEVGHKDCKVTWTASLGVRFKMLWRGSKITFGGYGPAHDTYAAFAESPAKAPVFVPGWDRPFEFERWIADPLRRGEDTDFKVFVGNRGDRTGAFAAVDDKFLPPGEYAIATLHYTDGAGKPAQAQFELRERC